MGFADDYHWLRMLTKYAILKRDNSTMEQRKADAKGFRKKRNIDGEFLSRYNYIFYGMVYQGKHPYF